MTDDALLQQYSESGDPTAFRELVDRYANYVFNICLRVTGDRQDAEDACQDCFLELARKAQTVRVNLLGWLHSVATHRSLNALRSKRRRQSREKAASRSDVETVEHGDWEDVRPLVDSALTGLSDEFRLPLLRHYFQGETQQDIADELNIDQATVSRRLAKGLELVRKRLQQRGVVTSVAVITAGLTSGTAEATSGVVGELTKIGVSGIGGAIVKSSASSVTANLAAIGTMAVNVFAVMFLQGWFFLLFLLAEFALLMYPPAWLRELLRAQAFGRDVVANPMYPFRRWTWTNPPADWKPRVFSWACVGSSMGVAAFSRSGRWKTEPGAVLALLLMSSMFFWLTARLLLRVWKYRDNALSHSESSQTSLADWTSWWSIGVAGVCAVVAGIWLFVFSSNASAELLVWLWFGMSSTLAVWALRDRLRNGPTQAPAVHEDLPMPSQRLILTGLVIMTLGFLTAGVLSQLVSPRPAKIVEPVYRYTADGEVVLMEIPRQLRMVAFEGRKPLMPVSGGMGLLFAALLLRRTIICRDQIKRSRYLVLLSLGAFGVLSGTAILGSAVVTQSAVSDSPTLIPTDEQVLAHAKRVQESVHRVSARSQERIERFAQESQLITLPDKAVPGSWYVRRSPYGVTSVPFTDLSDVRDIAVKLKLANVTEMDSLIALVQCAYIKAYGLPNDDNPQSVCHVYGFCCDTSSSAAALQQAWKAGFVCKNVVVFALDRTGLHTPTGHSVEPMRSLHQHMRQSQSVSQ